MSKKGVSTAGCETVLNTANDALDCVGWFDFSAVTDLSGSAGGAGQVLVTYDHDPATGQATAINYPDGGTRSFTYDTAGRVILDELTNSVGTVTASLAYDWSCEGDLVYQGVNLPGNTGSGDQTYTYDRAGRLSSWDKTSSQAAATTCGEGTPSGETYTYDNRGNRLTAGTRSFTYDNRNRLTTDPDGTYTWSAAGAMETFTATSGGQSESFTRDAAHRLIGVTSGADSVSYSYDAMDRIATRDGAETFAYAGGGIDPVADGVDLYARSSSQRLFAYEPAGGGFLFPMTNLHGDIVGYIDTNGSIAGASTYDPWGDPDDTTGTTSRLGYQGDWTEPSSGRVWMGARWYQPSSATFLTRDTYLGELGTPFSLNRYTYAVNNPVRYWDPDGRCSFATPSCWHRFLEMNGAPLSTPKPTHRPTTTKVWAAVDGGSFSQRTTLGSSTTGPSSGASRASSPARTETDRARRDNFIAINSGPDPFVELTSFDNIILPDVDPLEALGIYRTLSHTCPYCEGYNIRAGNGLACYGMSGCTEAMKYLEDVYWEDLEISSRELSNARFIAATYCQYNPCGAGNSTTLEDHIGTTAAIGDALLAAANPSGTFGRSLLKTLLRRNVDDSGRAVAGSLDDGIEVAAAGTRAGAVDDLASWGGEFLDDSLRMVDEPFARNSLGSVDLSTVGRTADEAAAINEYALRSNAWLDQNGPQTIVSTDGALRAEANAAVRVERLAAERAGRPYSGQAGHVPDTAITGQANPPGGWLDMPGYSNQVCGGVLGSRVGQVISGFTVDGVRPC